MVCRRHLLEAKRYGQDANHIPSWKTTVADSEPSASSLPPVKMCSNPQCENVIYERLIDPMFATNDKLAEIFNTESTDGPFVLCRQCYYKAYSTICVSHIESCGRNLLMEKAILLPWACKVFLHAYDTELVGSVKSARVSIDTGDSCLLFSAKWLLNELITHMSYKCVHMKFGTILYCRGIDLLVSLSWALSANSPFEDIQDTTVKHITPTAKQSDKLAALHNAGLMVNDLIHEEINRQSTARRNNPLLFDIDNELENINPLLLDFVNSITATVRERSILYWEGKMTPVNI